MKDARIVTQEMPLEFWKGVVGSPECREKSASSYLVGLLIENGVLPGAKIMDLASGTGEDSVYFARQGYDVTCNEISNEVRNLARQSSLNQGLNLAFTEGYDWRNLPEKLQCQFDAVLCVGNSFTYLFEDKDRDDAMRNFSSLVKRGGIVVVDHRNYDYMLAKRKNILTNPSCNFRWKGKYYYIGSGFSIFPTAIEDDFVEITCRKDETGERQHIGVYPIKREQLTDLMRSKGLRVRVYGDFNELSSHNKVGDCDFYQQVGIKE